MASRGDGGLLVSLDEPVRGVAAGQTAAVYAGDRVVGSATMLRAGRDNS
jgi:tRNA-specific 2-thiouridylase